MQVAPGTRENIIREGTCRLGIYKPCEGMICLFVCYQLENFSLNMEKTAWCFDFFISYFNDNYVWITCLLL